ncbi:MAG: hypothetical protein AB7N76_21750 [Planctomycetota bacterium]
MKRTGMLASTYLGGAALALWLSGSAAAEEAELPAPVQQKLRELDENGDGKLQPGEVPFDAEAFARGDRDHDGALSYLEAYRLHLTEEARKKGAAQLQKLQAKFREGDKDGDGFLSRAELPYPDAVFKRMDKDQDGKIDLDEALRASIEEELAEAFTKYDQDLSGTLSPAELPEPARAFFAAADANGDGQLSGEEAFAFVYETRRPRAGQGPARPAPPPAAPAAQAGGEKLGVLLVLQGQFAALDKDQDGKLTPEEMGATPELFKRLDKDQDGRVDRAELELRKGFALRLAERGKELRARVDRAGMAVELAVIGNEVQGLFFAGRYEEVGALMDQIELRLARREAGMTGK